MNLSFLIAAMPTSHDVSTFLTVAGMVLEVIS